MARRYINYKKLAENAIDLLATEYEEKFDDLYERGEIDDNGKNYEDQRDEWVDRQLIQYLPIDAQDLDEFLHGESVGAIEEALIEGVDWESKNLDQNSFEDQKSYDWATGHADGLSDALAIVQKLEYRDRDNNLATPKDAIAEILDVEKA